MNEFAEIRKNVKEAVDRYREVYQLVEKENGKLNDRSIECLATPFLRGYFTLAIVGKVSAGKSTFINALLGCKNLLPTGHDQTTSGITSIEFGETPEVQVKFGDDHIEVLKGDDISKKLKEYVAIPELYHDLPVNKIDEMILAGYGYPEIWECKEQLEKETLCIEIDEKLLREYIKGRSSKNIVREVSVKYPFKDELKGWRIIDTPGIGAIGGIEDRTRTLLAKEKKDRSREVDAIIFLEDGSQTLDQTENRKFVKEQLDNFTELDKKRLFFVLTHSGKDVFIELKERKLDFLNKSYGKKIEHLTYVDSLLELFIQEIHNTDIDLMSIVQGVGVKPDLPKWTKGEFMSVYNVLNAANLTITEQGESLNNETLLGTITEWSNFSSLKEELNRFTKSEFKEKLDSLSDLMKKDYENLITRLEEDKSLLEGEKKGIEDKINEVYDRKNKYSLALGEASNKISAKKLWSHFNFIDDDISQISDLLTMQEIRTAVTNLFDRVQSQERKIFRMLRITYLEYLTNVSFNDPIIRSMDFSEIERQAADNSTETYEISPEKIEKHISKPDKKIPPMYRTRVNEEEKLKLFKKIVVEEAKKNRDNFKDQIKKKAEQMSSIIKDELSQKISEEESRFKKLASNYDQAKQEVESIKKKIYYIKSVIVSQ